MDSEANGQISKHNKNNKNSKPTSCSFDDWFYSAMLGGLANSKKEKGE